ncbi:uncharacterized protein EV420DRAFT_1621492 [Desarmillaria tabescens]|uniref:CxC6 like cysteine cluster associated with KDZ domain-containing protein n=1 Tax=Armillaria tabescens TaxID=1929756 RepID=A0AA39K447_ARMTA|nr:uncharacterized protein EV420DRAFT_1621492 [Desarmillaria tabescens]KAK0454237.1 hypothetical protein EV420DRAFT_1621492 [Desarmillaria tabescens]
MANDADILYEFLGVDMTKPLSEIFSQPSPILTTDLLRCIVCPHEDIQTAYLAVTECKVCRTQYYPDRYRLRCDTQYLRILKHGVWEEAILSFHCSWRIKTGRTPTFSCAANSKTDVLVSAVREEIGRDGGIVPGAMEHACMDCTHKKCYRQDLIDEGADFGEEVGLIAGEDDVEGLEGSSEEINNTEPDLENGDSEIDTVDQLYAQVLAENELAPEGPRGYSRLAVIDGKTMRCTGALTNYKKGRFCRDHALEGLDDICGIVSCGRPRMTFPGVQRVIQAQQAHAIDSLIDSSMTPATTGNVPFRVELPELKGLAGNKIVHTFRARTTYCLQTVQWACSTPIGWGKCFTAESPSQVLTIIDNIWKDHSQYKPNFIAYNSSCKLLRHIVTQNPSNPWISSTKFIVDAWHYIGHKATDSLCQLWCNPAPRNGAQPDLVLVENDNDGHPHLTRAFNTETAEQFNAWLNGFKAQLRQMSNVNYDFFIHALMLLYKEDIGQRIEKKERELDEQFWEDVL